MKSAGYKSIPVLLLFLIVGGILGGIIGEVLSGLSFGSIMPDLVRHYEIFNIHNVTLNLYVMELTLGIHFCPESSQYYRNFSSCIYLQTNLGG